MPLLPLCFCRYDWSEHWEAFQGFGMWPSIPNLSFFFQDNSDHGSFSMCCSKPLEGLPLGEPQRAGGSSSREWVAAASRIMWLPGPYTSKSTPIGWEPFVTIHRQYSATFWTGFLKEQHLCEYIIEHIQYVLIKQKQNRKERCRDYTSLNKLVINMTYMVLQHWKILREVATVDDSEAASLVPLKLGSGQFKPEFST